MSRQLQLQEVGTHAIAHAVVWGVVSIATGVPLTLALAIAFLWTTYALTRRLIRDASSATSAKAIGALDTCLLTLAGVFTGLCLLLACVHMPNVIRDSARPFTAAVYENGVFVATSPAETCGAPQCKATDPVHLMVSTKPYGFKVLGWEQFVVSLRESLMPYMTTLSLAFAGLFLLALVFAAFAAFLGELFEKLVGPANSQEPKPKIIAANAGGPTASTSSAKSPKRSKQPRR